MLPASASATLCPDPIPIHPEKWGNAVNRKIRRANHRVTAVHESGHAVARYLTMKATGTTEADVISFIETTADGYSNCAGVWIPNPPAVQAALSAAGVVGVEEQARPEVARLMLSTLGLDLKQWAAAQMFSFIAGSAAEAKLIGLPLDLVLNSSPCAEDRQDIERARVVADLTVTAGNQLLVEQAAKVQAAMQRPEIWRAVLAVADRLPSRGRMSGVVVIETIKKAIGEAPAE